MTSLAAEPYVPLYNILASPKLFSLVHSFFFIPVWHIFIHTCLYANFMMSLSYRQQRCYSLPFNSNHEHITCLIRHRIFMQASFSGESCSVRKRLPYSVKYGFASYYDNVCNRHPLLIWILPLCYH